MDEREYRERMRGRLVEYLRLREEFGDAEAREALLGRYTEQQANRMGPLISGGSLAEGFAKVTRVFAGMGIEIEILDASADGVDSAVEVLTTCECLATCRAVGTGEPLSVLCELDNEAARRALPELTVEVLRQQVHGAHLCLFRYTREK